MADTEFELYLGMSRGRWNGQEPAKPLSRNAIARLGWNLERAEREVHALDDEYDELGPLADDTPEDERAEIARHVRGVRDRYHRAALAYIDAIQARDLCARVKFIRMRKVHTLQEGNGLWSDGIMARARSDKLHNLGPAFSSRRERIDADRAACQAEDLFEIAQAKHQERQREALADKRAGIIRRPASRIVRHSLRG